MFSSKYTNTAHIQTPINNTQLILLFFYYLIANIFLLLNYDAIYWDDWALYNHDYKTIYNMFKLNSNLLAGLIASMHFILIKNGVFLYKILTFIFWFFHVVFLKHILQQIKIIPHEDIFFLLIFVLLAPLYIARIALIDFPYTICLFIFYFAFYLLSNKYLQKPTILIRITVQLLFFLSFITNSLLVFYILPITFMFYKLYNCKKSLIQNIYYCVLTKIDFIALPVIFFALKLHFFQPTDIYNNYNQIAINFNTIKLILITFYHSFILPLKLSVSSTVLYLLIFFYLLLLLLQYIKDQIVISFKDDSKFILLGLFFFSVGCLPYLAVNKIPKMYDFASRHQLLLPLGFSFMLYYGIKQISIYAKLKSFYVKGILWFCIIAFTVFHLKEGMRQQIDRFYQLSIIENFKTSEIIKNNTTFIVKLNISQNKLTQNRTFRFYELNGFAKKAFGEDTRFLVPENNGTIEKYEHYKNYPQYNFHHWQKTEPITIYIQDNLSNIYYSKIEQAKFYIKLKYWQLFNYNQFREEVKKLVIIKT